MLENTTIIEAPFQGVYVVEWSRAQGYANGAAVYQ
jgi:hypothetical protein